MSASYAALTEGPGGKVSQEGADMLYTRYARAAGLCAGKRVLEVGCGPGLGLGLLAAAAAHVVGGDYDGRLLADARATYGSRVPLVRLDAQALPFGDGAFDVVLFFEGSYYVPDMERTFDEMVRVLAPGGTTMFVNANPQRPGFIPSPLSVHYHSADEFRRALSDRGLQVTVMGAFPVGRRGLKDRVLSTARTVANRLGLIPKTLGGRTVLKRLISGRLVDIPGEVTEGYASVSEPEPLTSGSPASSWKVVYVEARKG